ncbi:hypothetical protein NPIL_564011 [Nephila pilipes]|uniref:C2H2-type domain-containing protein n=1 Tax=Nephila pilipes TaxID=299642 RepID=A0A8X6PQ99_NEPPI|nr:hypothetical protein NPIL_564011 [Nephila pilipes]
MPPMLLNSASIYAVSFAPQQVPIVNELYIWPCDGTKLQHAKMNSFFCTQCHVTFDKLWLFRGTQNNSPFMGSLEIFACWKTSHETHSVGDFQCELCSFRGLSSRDLGYHLLEHAGDRNVCPLCGRTFVQRSGLRTHFRSHTRERPFACGECDERFSYKHVLRDHQLMHAGIKPYTCPICKKGFVQKSNMKLHCMSHKM